MLHHLPFITVTWMLFHFWFVLSSLSFLPYLYLVRVLSLSLSLSLAFHFSHFTCPERIHVTLPNTHFVLLSLWTFQFRSQYYYLFFCLRFYILTSMNIRIPSKVKHFCLHQVQIVYIFRKQASRKKNEMYSVQTNAVWPLLCVCVYVWRMRSFDESGFLISESYGEKEAEVCL